MPKASSFCIKNWNLAENYAFYPAILFFLKNVYYFDGKADLQRKGNIDRKTVCCSTPQVAVKVGPEPI